MKKPIKWYKPGKVIRVSDKMQKGYSYTLTEYPGKNFDPVFKPYYSPGQMLKLGVFEGKYLNDCENEFPSEWYDDARAVDKLRPGTADESINLFKIKSRQSLQEWQRKKWLIGNDPRGWFQWYCRYWLGRRDPSVDQHQIARWSSFVRHSGQVKASIKNMKVGDRPKTRSQLLKHRPKQRQALLQWAHNPFVK
jgi:hypothetical protein